MKTKGKKVIIALSGGRDSSVAAWLLKKQGFQVRGVFFTPHKFSNHKKAAQVAKSLNIPFEVWDFKKEFKKQIIADFINQYKKGNTPNPCVLCNRLIKFGEFYKRAKKKKADFIATGHYARILKRQNEYVLSKAKDMGKDQSYFLWGINKNHLKNIIFPLGNLSYNDVKKIAQANSLMGKDYKSSQEVCFIPGSAVSFLKKNLSEKKGKIIDINTKKELGLHSGVYFYTLGQRGGMGLSHGPWYVVEKNPTRNILYVTNKKKDLALNKKTCELIKTNFLKEIKFPFKANVKPRYRHPGSRALVKKVNKKVIVDFKQPQRALTPGQSCVFYQGNTLIGGGIIKK